MGEETKTIEPGADAYELNLDDGTETDVEEAMRSALDAVEKRQRDKPEDASPEPDEAEESNDEAEAASSSEDGREAAALKERLMRTLADFDNFRKRTEREKETLRRFAVSEVIKDVLGVVDNLERAMASSGSIEELKQGLDMILRQQGEVMRRFGVAPIEAVDQPFDPTVHEAVAREDSAEIDGPTVLRELQKGYMIHDRLLRPAMVHVAMPIHPSKAKSAGDDDGDQGAASE